MDTLTLDRTTSIDALFSFIGAEKVTISREVGRIVLTPEAEPDDRPSDYPDPADYPDTTAYLNAIPGMAESIIESMNAPRSAFRQVRPRMGTHLHAADVIPQPGFSASVL